MKDITETETIDKSKVIKSYKILLFCLFYCF
jgi:hypothetical protein